MKIAICLIITILCVPCLGGGFITQPGITADYYSGYMIGHYSTSSASYADPSISSGSNTLTQRQASGLTVTAAASNLPGITFTPANSASVYEVGAIFSTYAASAGNAVIFRLTDGSTTIQEGNVAQGPVTSAFEIPSVSLRGIFVPGTGSPVTVKIQLAATGGTVGITESGVSSGTIEWVVVRIK